MAGMTVKFRKGVWTLFRDTYAEAIHRLPKNFVGELAIEAPEELAEEIFRARMGFSHYGSCECCGPYFGVEEMTEEPDSSVKLRAKDGWAFPPGYGPK